MNIHGSLPRLADRLPSATGGSTYASANHVTTDEIRRDAGDVDAARNTALSALRNDRFGTMLRQISEPAVSGALMTMKRDTDGASAGFNSVLSSYAENFE
jgi:hypothetical protein